MIFERESLWKLFTKSMKSTIALFHSSSENTSQMCSMTETYL